MFKLRFPVLFAALALIGLFTTQCSTESVDPTGSTGKVSTKAKDNSNPNVVGSPLDAPTLSLATKGMASLVIRVCAGPSGAPAGFSLQWMKKADYVAGGNTWSDNAASHCAASFSGNANSSRYELDANECVDVRVGDLLLGNGASGGCGMLECGTEYVFRAFAHTVPGQGGSKSDWSATFSASTWQCEIKPGMMCTRTAGEWRDNPISWPVTSLMLGTRSYTQVELLAILNASPGNNGLVALAQQLITTKLNVAAGSPSSYVWHPILMADQMIGALVVPPVGGGSLTYATVNERMNYFANYNDGAIGPGHCFSAAGR